MDLNDSDYAINYSQIEKCLCCVVILFIGMINMIMLSLSEHMCREYCTTDNNRYMGSMDYKLYQALRNGRHGSGWCDDSLTTKHSLVLK